MKTKGLVINANELMIGDWVSLGDGAQNAKVLEIREKSIIAECEDETDCLFSYFWPIEITEEILYANGFVKDSHKKYVKYIHTNYDFTILLFYEEHHSVLTINVNCGEPVYGVRDISETLVWRIPKYVHELQHALRLCGLRDIADQFKIRDDAEV